MSADLIVTGRIATFAGPSDSGFGWAEAIAVRAGRVVAAGTKSAVETAFGTGMRRLDLPPDAVVLPGLTDAHLHLVDVALASERIDLAESGGLDVALARIRAAHESLRAPDAWLEGHGWDPTRWGRWPTASDLESVAPGRRIALWSHDHHAIWASEAALAAAGIDEHTADPRGGIIRRLTGGRPEGCLQERAAALVMRVIPAPGVERIERAIGVMARELLACGLVAVHDPGDIAPDPTLASGFAAYVRLADRGALPIRVHASVRREGLATAIARGYRSGKPPVANDRDARLRVGWLKLFADGTLGSRTARLLAPYELDATAAGATATASATPPSGHAAPTTEHSDDRGIWSLPPAELDEAVRAAADAGIASQIHAIGDAAVRVSLDVLARHASKGRPMPRIEHAQLVDPADLPRFAALGVAASVQPGHIGSDAANARRFWGRRVERGGYAYASLARSGAVLAFGTDAPVEPFDPWPGIALAVTRRASTWPGDDPAFVPSEALSLARALRAACVDPALVAGETDRGRLTFGQRADFVVVPSAAFDVPEPSAEILRSVRPLLVAIDGAVVYEL